MRRTLPTAAVAALAGAVLSLPAAGGTALAHGGTLDVEITGHDFGRVRTTVVWENDKDPVEGRVAATVNAVADDGRTAGPFRLVRDPGSATGWTADGTLPPGRWTVTVEAGHPALGRDEEEITVSPGTPASPTPADGPGTAGPGAATPDQAAGHEAPATGPDTPTTGPATPPTEPDTPAAPNTPDAAAADASQPGGWTGLAVGGAVVAALVGGTFAVLAHRVRRRRDPGRPLSPRR
ncbi:hypothetical protein [Streptomyces sp. NPDC005805]|uniref:hypothetical protein n=1 Tax=Streptomyces sp. NPDC005805 TaxID=3157068 RepID=UPI0033F6A7CD